MKRDLSQLSDGELLEKFQKAEETNDDITCGQILIERDTRFLKTYHCDNQGEVMHQAVFATKYAYPDREFVVRIKR